jgi:hypothetical protein
MTEQDRESLRSIETWIAAFNEGRNEAMQNVQLNKALQNQATNSGVTAAVPNDKSDYIQNDLNLYDFQASYRDSEFDGRVVGVDFKIKNTGGRTLNKVEVTVYFNDSSGATIHEEKYYPVLVSDFNVSDDNEPLKPGYIWQQEANKFYEAKNVPSEWQDGNAIATITDIEFDTQ